MAVTNQTKMIRSTLEKESVRVPLSHLARFDYPVATLLVGINGKHCSRLINFILDDLKVAQHWSDDEKSLAYLYRPLSQSKMVKY